jgi:hypothetical protein
MPTGRQDLYVTFRKPILPDEEANMKAIPRKQRAMVRKGIKNGLTSALDDGVTASSRCMPTTCTATARRPCPPLLRGAAREFGADCEC